MVFKNIGITEFYYKIKKHIAFHKAYYESKTLDFIIQACRLKPLYILQSKEFPKTSLFNEWIDEFGNSLSFHFWKDSQKNIKRLSFDITLNDPKITNKIWPQYLSTDLYLGLSLKEIAKISKSCYLLIGKTKESYEDHFIVSLLGIDNYLRTFVYIKGKWKTIPTLYLGGKALKRLGPLKNLEKFLEIKKQKYEIIVPCAKQQSWLSSLPLAPKISEFIKENNLSELEFLTKENACQEL